MKKNLLICFLLSISFVAFSQETEESVSHTRKNDLLIDPIFLIAGPIVNASYERILNEDYGVGVHTLFGLGAMDEIVQISPYARMYTGKKYASGFFLEAFVPITSTKEDVSRYDDNTGNYIERRDERNSTVGLGVGLGGKWVVKRSIVLEIGGGVARRFGYKGTTGEPITGKWMMGIGYKF